MLVTRGFENKHAVRIYDTIVVGNTTAIDIAKGYNDPKSYPVPEPLMVEKVYIEVKVPQSKSGYHGVITENLKKNFSLTWLAFQEGLESSNSKGTPLDALPDMNTSVKEHLEKAGFKTLESLAEADDTVVVKFPFGMKMREKAKLVLKSLDDDKLDGAIDDLAELREVIEAQAKQIKILTSSKKESKSDSKKEKQTA